MKIGVALYRLIAISLLGAVSSTIAKQPFLGSIIFPDIKLKAPLYIFYSNGEHLVTNDGTFEIYEDEWCPLFNVLITDVVSIVYDDDYKDVLYFETPKGSTADSCKYFHLSRKTMCELKTDQSGKEYYDTAIWDLKEIKIKQHPFKIPLDYTMIILVPARWVEKLVQDEWNPKSKTIKLPSIVLDKKLTQEKVKNELITACSTAIDLKAFHRAAEKELQYKRLTTIACNKD